MVDLTPEYTDIRDETTFARDGSTQKTKKVTFYLGKFGPFTERFPADTFSMSEVQARVDQLKSHLQLLQR